MRPIRVGDVLYGQLTCKNWKVLRMDSLGFNVEAYQWTSLNPKSQPRYDWSFPPVMRHLDTEEIDWLASALQARQPETALTPDVILDLSPASAPAWMQFRHDLAHPGECPCGVPKAVCEYHR